MKERSNKHFAWRKLKTFLSKPTTPIWASYSSFPQPYQKIITIGQVSLSFDFLYNDAPNRQCNSTFPCDRIWLSVGFDCGYSPLLNTCDFGGAEKDASEGSIKNWPSILRCCLGGVRGTGQIVLLGVLVWGVENEVSVGKNGTVDGVCSTCS